MSPTALAALAAVLALAVGCVGYPNGAPTGSCGELVPGHPSSAQDGRSPFAVAPSRARTEEGRVRVMLESPQGVGFTGFMLVARPASGGLLEDGSASLGHFSGIPDKAKALACGKAARVSASLKYFRGNSFWRRGGASSSACDPVVLSSAVFVSRVALPTAARSGRPAWSSSGRLPKTSRAPWCSSKLAL